MVRVRYALDRLRFLLGSDLPIAGTVGPPLPAGVGLLEGERTRFWVMLKELTKVMGLAKEGGSFWVMRGGVCGCWCACPRQEVFGNRGSQIYGKNSCVSQIHHSYSRILVAWNESHGCRGC